MLFVNKWSTENSCTINTCEICFLIDKKFFFKNLKTFSHHDDDDGNYPVLFFEKYFSTNKYYT